MTVAPGSTSFTVSSSLSGSAVTLTSGAYEFPAIVRLVEFRESEFMIFLHIVKQ
ncbi:hypothetical protein ACT8ZS_06820 [Paenibacillus sp. M.A.Huq-84]